jgi:sulfonate dioxygenase
VESKGKVSKDKDRPSRSSEASAHCHSRYPPLTPFEHYDHGRDADPSFPNLLKEAKVTSLCAKIGAEVHGVQLSKLDSKGLDELALFVAQKKVVAFRNQDFADIPIKDAVEIGRYFGRLHIHPTSGQPEGFPEVHLVHRGAEDKFAAEFLKERTNSVQWHSDVTYEEQPPATTFLYILDGPEAGGDTLFADQTQAYQRLSPEFRKRLDGLYAVHSGKSASMGVILLLALELTDRFSHRAGQFQPQQGFHLSP